MRYLLKPLSGLALHRNQSGQIAIPSVLLLLTVFVLAALALDSGLWFFDHRHAQNQAEAAAQAAAIELPAPTTALATTQANAWLAKNREASITLTEVATEALCASELSSTTGGRIAYTDTDSDGKY